MSEQSSGTGNDRRITVTRTFDAPPEALWRAWTNEQQVAQWFAPEPYTVPVAEIEPKPGGVFRIVMRDPEGHDFPGDGKFLEVEEPRKLVYTDSVTEMPSEWVDALNEARGEAPGTPVADGVATVTFVQADGGTEMTFSEEFDSKQTRDAYEQMGMVEGLNMSFDNLEKQLGVTAEDLSC